MSSISQTEGFIQQNLYPLLLNGWQEKKLYVWENDSYRKTMNVPET